MTSHRTTTSNRTAPLNRVDGLAARLGSTGAARPTLLAVWAHPDDETVVGAGLMAAAAAQGFRVVSVAATLGEHGTDDPVASPPARLARIREQELARALTRLGADRPVLFGYEDGDCENIADEAGAERVGSVIDRFDPTAVLTFGPDGVTGHPDHQAVGRWTASALRARGDSTPLIETAAADAWPEDVVDGLHELGAFWPGHPCHERPDDSHRVSVGGALLTRKMAALRDHSSQMTRLFDHLGETGMRRMAAAEAYRPSNAMAAEMFATRRDDRRTVLAA